MQPPPPIVPPDPFDRLADALRELPSDSGSGVPDSRPADAVESGGLVPPHLLRLRRYVVLRSLGRGGMGAVYLAHPRDLPDREVALKVLPPFFSDDALRLERFRREALTASRIDHPGVARVHEVGEEGGVHYQIQDLVPDGRTLSDWIREARDARTLPKGWWLEVARTFEQVALALSAVHAGNVIHRDIKPSNILLMPDGRPKVCDFGLAKDLEGLSGLTRDGSPGTLNYKSPEQIDRRHGKVDQRSDVFGLGATLYEALTLTRLYPGDDPAEVQPRILRHDVEDLRQARPGVPRELSVICRKCLEREQGRRYQTMAELAADLGRYLRDEPILAVEPGVVERAVKWSRRNPGPSAALGVGAAALAVISGLLVQQVRTAAELEMSNQALGKSNVELAAQTQRAEAGEREARDSATAAQLARDEATQKTNDVLSLSAQKDHDDLVAQAAKLWPAHPEMIPAYEDWLRRANELIEGRPESPGRKRRPSLAEHKVKLEELRRDAKELSDDQVRAERESHPKYAELQAKQAELLWRSRMLDEEPWPSEAAVEAELAKESLPTDADALNSLAWPLVDPAKPVYGQEVRALLLARRAVAAASEEKRSEIRDTLAWALFKVGRLDEALSEERTALSGPGGEALKASAADLEKEVALWRGDEVAKRRQTRDKLFEEVAALTTRVNERRTYEFDDPEKEWWNRQLVKLVSDLEALRDPQSGLMNDVLAEPFGWGVAKRYAFAQSIGEHSVGGADASRLWSKAIAAIKASPKYGSLEIEPQMGLLPIGMDPDSQLWEFAHLQTGDPAARGADGKLVLTEETGLVFVLIPGGTFWMGAQNKPGAQNHDPMARGDEGPVHEVELSPYFLSKYEMTQGQWERIAAANPSYYKPPGGFAPSLLHPVEQVSWPMCFDLMRDLGLALPSEAQWERAARGGTSTAWWTGPERESLRGNVNLADQTAKKAGASWAQIADWPDLEDGSVVHCAVGKYAANAFGLHEVAGNVWEWCLDGYDSGFYGKKSGKDPLSPWSGSSNRVGRGGSFSYAASIARSAFRSNSPPELRDYPLGLRPSRALRLSPSPLHPPK